MQPRNLLKETNLTPSDHINMFARKPPVSAGLPNSNASPRNEVFSASKQDPKILCKRIDNTAHNVNIKNDQPSNQKFVPLAFPLENLKKKSGQPSLTRAEGIGQPDKKYTQSTPQSVIHSQPETRPQSMPVSQNTSLTFNPDDFYRNDPKGFRAQKVSRQYEQEVYRASMEQGRGLMEKLLLSPGKEQKKPGLPKKKANALKKPSVSDKSPRKQVLQSIKERRELGKLNSAAINQRSMKDLRDDDSAKARSRQFENNRMIKSGKNSKAASPVRVEQPAPVQKKTMRKVTKREHVSKSEVPPALEELIQRNANEYLEGLKAKKHVSELEKKMKDERKKVIEEGNKMIRAANMQRFNVVGIPPRPQIKSAWGAGQPKQPTYDRPETAHQRAKSKLEDQDRRKVLGLEHLDEERIRQLQKKALIEQRQREKSVEQMKPKKQLDSEEKMRLKEYMNIKKAKIEQEQFHKDIQVVEDQERKKRNLEKLYGVIQESREREVKKTKPITKKKLKKRKERSPRGATRRKNIEDIVAERNSSAYYREYMNIIGSRQNAEEAYKAQLKQQEELRGLKKKGGYIVENRDEYHSKGKKSSGRGKDMYDYERREAQEVMMKMDTHSFSDDDDIKSNRMMIGDRKSDSAGESKGNVPEDSVREILEAREIIEAAVIFIQKNYRGYRTRKLLKMFFDQLYLDEMERIEQEREKYYQEQEEEQEEQEDEEEKESEGEEEEEEEEEVHHYEEQRKVVPMLENKKQQQIQHDKKSFEKERVQIENFDDEDEDNEEFGKEDEEDEDIEQEELDEEEQYYSQQRLREQYNREVYGKSGADKMMATNEDTERLKYMKQIDQHGYFESSHPSRYSDQTSSVRVVEDYLRDQKLPKKNEVQQQKRAPEPEPEDEQEEEEEEEEEEGFGQIQILRRAKSDGELLADRQFGIDDDMEDSNQISFHDDDVGDSYGQMRGHGHGGYNQGYLKGVTMKGGMLAMDNSEHTDRMEDEEIDEGHPFQSEGQSSGREYEDQARYQGYLQQKGLQIPAQFSQLNKVSTVNSVSVPTKNLIESQFNPDTKLIRSGDYINAQSEEYIPSEPGLHSHLDASIPFEIPFEEESKTELKVPKDISGIGEFEGGEEEKMMRLSNPLETNESPVQESPVKSEELLKRHTVQSITIEKQEVEEKSLKGRRIEQEEEENKKDEAIQTVERSPITYGHSEEGLSLPTGARSSITQHEKMLLQKTFELSTHYQNELVRLREEQAKQWSEVISQLEVLQTQGDVNLNQKVKHFVENLSKQSEINKKQLMENMELQNLVKTQSGLSERSLMTEVEILLKQRPEESKNATERSLASFKKVESPAHSEGKFQKKRKPMEFAKKPNLEIDVNTANDDQGEGNGGMNLDLSQMRLALGSEQLVRQQSARTLSQSLGTPTDLEMIDLNTPENIDGAVSIFERDPFKEFTHKKLGELMSKDSMQKIFKMREDALEMRHKSQMDSMKKMLEAHKFSPRTFQNKAIELEKWVTKERENIQRNKKNMERGWLSTADSIKRTQRDIEFIQKSSGPQGEGRHSTMSDLSLRQSFADEEHLKTDHGETSIDKYSVRSSVQRQTMGTEVISPTASKNIKIVDKFELHDTPDVKKVDEKRKDSIHSDILQKEISSRQFTEEKETEKSEREARSPDYPRFSPEKKEGRDTTPLSFKNNSQVAYSGGAGSLRHLDHEPMTEGDFEAGLTEKEIDWQSEARVSVPVIPSKSEYKATRTEESAPPTKYRRTQVHLTEGSENRSGSSSSHTPKGNNDIRSMIQEHLDNGKLVDIVNKDQDASYKEEKSMESKRKDLSGRKETLTEEDQPPRETGHDLNIQKKTDIITEEVFKALIEEFGQEFMDTAGREQVVEKVKELEKGGVEAVLQNLIENKYFFTAGAEKHPGFQANIAMPPAELVHEIEKLHHQADIYAQKDEIDEDITQEEVSKHELEKEVHTTEEQEQEAAVKKEEDESEVLPDGVDEDQVQHTESQAGEAGDLYRVLGIKTDMKAVEAYLDILISEIKGDYLTEFLRNINVPIGLSVTEKLNNMHAYDPAGSESSLEMSAGLQQAILSIQLYLEIETKIMEENPLKNEVSVELEHIHNKMIFDCLNEVLDSHRPYGLVGEPYPWKSTIRSNQPTPITRHNIERVLQTAKKKVLAWATYICGYYGEKDDFIQDRTQSFVEEYLAQVKEEKLSKMLAAEIHEVEDKWLAYDDEEAEVQLEISDLIFDKLVTEAAELIVQINNSRRGVKPKQPELPKLEEKKLKRKGSL